MTPERLLESVGNADEALLYRSERRSFHRVIAPATAAVVLCLAFWGYASAVKDPAGPSLQVPTASSIPMAQTHDAHQTPLLQPDDYFRDCKVPDASIITDSKTLLPDYAWIEFTDFSCLREDLETDGILPVLESHEEFEITAVYDEGKLSHVMIRWGHRGSLAEYSDLSVVIAPQEVEIPECYVVRCIDEEGNVIEPTVTITERDGVQIAGSIEANGARTLTFQTEEGWYRLEGSFNDDSKAVVELLDWFWEHPLDLGRFEKSTE